MSTNTKKLTGKVAVVTGASKGIGAAISRHPAGEGADRVVNEITAQGGRAAAAQANVRHTEKLDPVVTPEELAHNKQRN
jgi:3-oxoacyl-[acyl-carrier protein] reductase